MNFRSSDRKIYYLFILLFVVFTYNAFNYDLKFQQDSQNNHYPILNIMLMNFDSIKAFYGLLYYFYVSIFSIFAFPFYNFDILSPREAFYLTIRISNTFLFILTFFLSYNLSKKIFKSSDFYSLLPVIIIFSFSSIHRTFFMARVENIFIPLVLLIISLTYDLLKKKSLNKKNTFFLIFSIFIIGSQQINGLIFIFTYFFFLLLFYKDYKNLLKFFVITLFLICCYYILHYYIVGSSVVKLPYEMDSKIGKIGLFNLGQSFNIFYNFSFSNSWENPLRYAQSNSMLNTFFLDLFGDYYGYGHFNYKKNDGAMTKDLVVCLANINRVSLILSIIFFLFFIISIIFYIFKINLKNTKDKIFLFQILSFLSGIFVIVAITIRLYEPNHTLFKWEYINYCLIGSSFIITNYIIYLKKNNNILNKIQLFLFFLLIILSYNQILPSRC